MPQKRKKRSLTGRREKTKATNVKSEQREDDVVKVEAMPRKSKGASTSRETTAIPSSAKSLSRKRRGKANRLTDNAAFKYRPCSGSRHTRGRRRVQGRCVGRSYKTRFPCGSPASDRYQPQEYLPLLHPCNAGQNRCI